LCGELDQPVSCIASTPEGIALPYSLALMVALLSISSMTFDAALTMVSPPPPPIVSSGVPSVAATSSYAPSYVVDARSAWTACSN
jgi:hypothetical protein